MRAVVQGNLAECRSSVRLRQGIAFVAVSLLLTGFVVQSGLPLGYRVALILPFFMSALAVLQGLYGTCLMRAAYGEREEPGGEAEPILDPDVRRRLRSEMTALMMRAGAVAAGCTAVVWALP